MDSPSTELTFTGERFIPGTRGEIWIEHWHRYHFAARLAAGRRVLDVACGEGYGSALLARVAASVVGVDVSPQAIAHAEAAYRGIANLEFRSASCTALPLDAASIEVAICFETLEHIAEQRELVAELARVLRPDGLLVISCPNKREYTDRRGYVNEFHVNEPYREELEALLVERFPARAWYGQRPTFFSVIAPEAAPSAGELFEVDESDPAFAAPRLAEPMYFVVMASRDARALAAAPAVLSVLADRGDWVHRDYEKVMRDLEHHAARGKALEATLAAREDTLAERERELAASRREVARRGSWRWWLRLPLVRLGLLD